MIKLVEHGLVELAVYQTFLQEGECVFFDDSTFPCILPAAAIPDSPMSTRFLTYERDLVSEDVSQVGPVSIFEAHAVPWGGTALYCMFLEGERPAVND
ncbi:hypothetical protein BC628DRAFT_1394015 [Trametes gibbosa]|nr:hypothetical protein BC628DRAFT_1394015 [Trametes gibbosa]